jgi:hypothetical protein
MGDESGSIEMLEMVERHSVLHGPAMRQATDLSTISNRRMKGEIVCKYTSSIFLGSC